ncbi:MAG: hypothetical protein IIB38_01310, partial [Candidatus Hydrogenedentes bacterium]|nr:hypothetical protein [Candidatus Hydrogenedentota bacterium]
MDSGALRRSGKFLEVANIPNGIVMEWMKLYGVDALNKDHIPAVVALCNSPEWRDAVSCVNFDYSKRTRKTLLAGVEVALNDSIEDEKVVNDFLAGVPAIVEALRSGQIKARVYTKAKFHAKAYITHAKSAVVGSTALVGSSNFTYPGLTTNVELNVQLRREVNLLQAWFNSHWEDAEDVTRDVLKVIERHTADYSPFEVYALALQQYFKGHELTVTEWERNESQMFPVLDQYQKEGYQALMKIAENYNGALLCDGVGLGKTFEALAVIKYHELRNDRVLVLCPKRLRDNWTLYAANDRRNVLADDRFNYDVLNHTDLSRDGGLSGDIDLAHVNWGNY